MSVPRKKGEGRRGKGGKEKGGKEKGEGGAKKKGGGIKQLVSDLIRE